MSESQEAETTISEGNQTVVPSHLREKYDLKPGDKLIWSETRNGILVRPRKKYSWKDITALGEHGGNAVETKKKIQRGEK